MTPKQASELLREYNDWRTDKPGSSRYMPNPKEITKALNTAIEFIDNRMKYE